MPLSEMYRLENKDSKKNPQKLITFPLCRYTKNETFPNMNYSYELNLDMEELIKDGRSIMKHVYGSTFQSKLNT